MLVLEVELVVAVAGAVDGHFVEGKDHLLPPLDVGEGRRREAIPREQSEGLRVLPAQLLHFRLEVADTHGAALGLQVIDIVEMDYSK